jgi:hypothetical protein
VWTLSVPVAGGAVLLLCYEWVRATGQFVRLAVGGGYVDQAVWHRVDLHPALVWMTLETLAACCMQFLLLRAVRRRRRLVDEVAERCRRGRWGLAHLVRGARVWPEVVSGTCMLLTPAAVVVLLERARDDEIEALGMWMDPRAWASVLGGAVALQREVLVLGGALCLVSLISGLVVMMLLVVWRLRLDALRNVARSARAEAPPQPHPYRGALRTDAEAIAWIAAPGPGARTAIAGAGVLALLVVAPVCWAVVGYGAELLLDRDPHADGQALDVLTYAEARLEDGFLVATFGALAWWAAVLVVFCWWASRRSAIAPEAQRCSGSLRLTAGVALVSAVVTAVGLPLACAFHAENALALPQAGRRLGGPPVMLPEGFPFVTAFDPVITVLQDRYEVDGTALGETTLRERLARYRRSYPAWAAGQGRFVVIASRRDTPMHRIREAFTAAYEAGYEVAFIPAEHDCRVEHRPVMGNLWDCRVSTARIALGASTPKSGPWQAAMFGEFSERVMLQAKPPGGT